MSGSGLRAATMAASLNVVLLVAGTANAADLSGAAPARGCVQAVDGMNGKAGADGGTFSDKTLYSGLGSLAVPLGCEYGFQVDGSVGSFNENGIYAVGGHLFWRNPSVGLLGMYGSSIHWDQFSGVTANHVGPEAEWYFGRWTIQGVAGVEFGNSTSGQVGPNIVTYDVNTRFFDQINFAYYINDNLKVFLGHRYLGGKNALAIGGEWGVPVGRGTMGSLFVEGRVGEDNATGVWGGIRFYFGHQDKSLIRRNREDDPADWNAGGFPNPGNSTPAPTPRAPQTCCPTIGALVVAGAKLAENLAVTTTCCKGTTLLDSSPGAQLAENLATVTTCSCPV